jgi:2-polyprenyl-6-methoxyphenol hydroxylase-like FAD-dependent oxidoreductase
MNLPRPYLTKLLYNGLKDKKKIKTSAYIEDFQTNEKGVQLELRNGDVVKGSIVIGCDGAHSQIKNISEYTPAQI